MAVVSKERVLEVLREEMYSVLSSVSPHGTPQAALVGVVVSDQFELFFDTLGSSRKAANLRVAPRISAVLGPTHAASVRTIQYEGLADEPSGNELERFLHLYFEKFPDGRARRKLPEIAYFRVKPVWLRFSDFSSEPPTIVEFHATELVS